MKNKILVIDGNNLLYRVYYKFSAMKAQDGKPTGISYGFPMVLQSLITKLRPKGVVVVFDGGRSKTRMRILPGYKEREKKEGFDKDDFYRQKAVVKEFLRIFCIPVVEMKGEEADDIMWVISRRLKRRNKIVLVSSDKDFVQLLSDKLTIWNPHKNILLTTDNCKAIMGYESHQTVDYLCLDGDASDNIPGYPGVGPKTAIAFLEKYDSIENFLESGDEKFKRIRPKKLKELYAVNKTLIDIKLYYKLYMDSTSIQYSVTGKSINEEELAYLCADHSIRTFIKKPFIKTFKNLL